MKKLSVIFTMVFTLGFLSCSNIQGSQNNEVPPTAQENKEVAEDEIKPEHLTYETFKEKVWDFEKNPQEWVYEGDVPCVIDFYADWCKPCKMVAPIMDELAIDYDGKVKIYKINTEKERELAGAFGIRSIPSVLFCPMEGRPTMSQGALPKAEFVKIIEENLLKNNNK